MSIEDAPLTFASGAAMPRIIAELSQDAWRVEMRLFDLAMQDVLQLQKIYRPFLIAAQRRTCSSWSLSCSAPAQGRWSIFRPFLERSRYRLRGDGATWPVLAWRCCPTFPGRSGKAHVIERACGDFSPQEARRSSYRKVTGRPT